MSRAPGVRPAAMSAALMTSERSSSRRWRLVDVGERRAHPRRQLARRRAAAAIADVVLGRARLEHRVADHAARRRGDLRHRAADDPVELDDPLDRHAAVERRLEALGDLEVVLAVDRARRRRRSAGRTRRASARSCSRSQPGASRRGRGPCTASRWRAPARPAAARGGPRRRPRRSSSSVHALRRAARAAAARAPRARRPRARRAGRRTRRPRRGVSRSGGVRPRAQNAVIRWSSSASIPAPPTPATAWSRARGGRLAALDGGVIETARRRWRRAPAGHDLRPACRSCSTSTSPTRSRSRSSTSAPNARSAFAVGQARGVVMLAAGQRGIACSGYTPQQVKGAVCGTGRADKDQVQRMVQALLALPELPDARPRRRRARRRHLPRQPGAAGRRAGRPHDRARPRRGRRPPPRPRRRRRRRRRLPPGGLRRDAAPGAGGRARR